MSLNNFVPEVWAAEILRNLHLKTVFGGLCNRNYEGEIKEKGDTVRINAIGPITVFDYVKDTDMPSPQALADSQATLVIEKQKGFNFAVDDVDKVQGNPAVMAEAMYEASYALANTQDQYIAGLYTDTATLNFIGTDASPKVPTLATDIYGYLVAAKVKLDEANVPTDGRWAVVPPWFEGYMLQDSRFVLSYQLDVSKEALKNGQVARAAGFDIMNSNNITFNGSFATGNYRIMCGHPMAITLAEQVNKTEAFRPPARFADAVKGLNMYGAKVVRPQALAVITATRF